MQFSSMRIRNIFMALPLMLLMAGPSQAETPKAYPPAKVSFADFKSLVAAVEPHRAERLVDLDTFLKMSMEPGTIILDTRSDFRFERLHLKGAKHLSFTDFTQDNLAKIIPSPSTRILLYCNNNFEGNQVEFASKVASPVPVNANKVAQPGPANANISNQIISQQKPLMMALNIPTYVNLYGYGYLNVYELDELVDVKDRRIAFEGTLVSPPAANLSSEDVRAVP